MLTLVFMGVKRSSMPIEQCLIATLKQVKDVWLNVYQSFILKNIITGIK